MENAKKTIPGQGHVVGVIFQKEISFILHPRRDRED
jgi:hypothetical protein